MAIVNVRGCVPTSVSALHRNVTSSKALYPSGVLPTFCNSVINPSMREQPKPHPLPCPIPFRIASVRELRLRNSATVQT